MTNSDFISMIYRVFSIPINTPLEDALYLIMETEKQAAVDRSSADYLKMILKSQFGLKAI